MERTENTSKRSESRRERFIRVVLPRVKQAAHAIRLVSYGGAKERYDYTLEDAEAIAKYLQDAVDETMLAFNIRPRSQVNLDAEAIAQRLEQAVAAAVDTAERKINEARRKELETLEAEHRHILEETRQEAVQMIRNNLGDVSGERKSDIAALLKDAG